MRRNTMEFVTAVVEENGGDGKVEKTNNNNNNNKRMGIGRVRFQT